jgi:chromate transporter
VNKELKDLAKLFLKLGTIGFGGPAAHIAMMHNEVVNKRKWLDEQHFLDLIGATNLIPGPNSTEMAIHIGRERAGWKGLMVAGICFILPAVALTLILAVFYKKYGQLPQVQPFIYGIKPATISIIIAAVYPLARKSLKTPCLWMIGLAAIISSISGLGEITIIFGAGFLNLGFHALKKKLLISGTGILPFLSFRDQIAPIVGLTNFGLFVKFLKIGSILYGSGYVLFAYLNTELVSKGIITHNQLIDAISVGQITPGPVFSSVTFIGYQINDIQGALLATLGVFLPSFVFVSILNPLVSKMRNSALASAFLDAVNVASVAVILVVCYEMGKDAISNWHTIIIGTVCLLIVFGFKKVNSVFVVVAGAGLGYVLSLTV